MSVHALEPEHLHGLGFLHIGIAYSHSFTYLFSKFICILRAPSI